CRLFTDTPTTATATLSLHAALPIFGAARGVGERAHEAVDLLHHQRAWRLLHERIRDGGRRDGLLARDPRLRLPPRVVQLRPDDGAVRVSDLDQAGEAVDHGVVMQPELVVEATAVLAHEARLQDQRPRATAGDALDVGPVPRRRAPVLVRVVAHHRRHDHAVLRFDAADAARTEERRQAGHSVLLL